MIVEFINKDYEIEPFYNVGAGDLISIDFDYRNCTIEEYADILGFPVEMTKNLLENKIHITEDIAKRIEEVTGMAPYILYKQEKEYMERKEREERAEKSKPVYKSAQTQIAREM